MLKPEGLENVVMTVEKLQMLQSLRLR